MKIATVEKSQEEEEEDVTHRQQMLGIEGKIYGSEKEKKNQTANI